MPQGMAVMAESVTEVAPAPPAPAEEADDPPEQQSVGESPRHSNKIELIIDSLPRYHLVKPIQVLINSLGDQVFTAKVQDLNIATTGSTVGEALLSLKEQIESIYEDLNKTPPWDDDHRRLAKFFDNHISMERHAIKPSWYHRR